MEDIWGIILILVSGLGYGGQVLTVVWPAKAAQLGMTQPESSYDPTFSADSRGEALWDTAILWILPVAGVLLELDNPMWAYFGLVGGGMYLYFAGRGIVVRQVMQRRNIRIGVPEMQTMIYLFLVVWGVVAVITIWLAISALQAS
jgi:hypothetical protein